MLVLYWPEKGFPQYIAEEFSKKAGALCYSFTEESFAAEWEKQDTIVFCYPVRHSGIPRFVRSFAGRYAERLKGKQVILFCTQKLFSGDGARAFTDLFPEEYLRVIYAEHFFTPFDRGAFSPCLPPEERQPLRGRRKQAEKKLERICRDLRAGTCVLRGFRGPGRVMGSFCRRNQLMSEQMETRRISHDRAG